MAGSVARVASLEGQAWAKAPDGTQRPLAVGDTVAADEVVITATGAHIELDFGDGHPVSIAGGQEVTLSPDLWQDLATDKKEAALDDASVQEALRVLDNGGDLTENLEETAAGLTGGGANEGHSFVELTRVVEGTNPLAFDFGATNLDAANTTQTLSSGIVTNHAPQVGDQSLSGDEDSVISGQIIATDIEGDALTYTLVGQPANGTLVLDANTGGFSYTPNANYNGPDSFVVTVTDPAGNTTSTTVAIGVNPVNDAPVTADQSLITAEDTPISGRVTATDVDGDTVTFSLTSAASNGTVTLDPATGAFIYTPSANFNGSDSFVVTLSDGKGGSTSSTIAIGVTPVNDAPETNPAAATGNEDNTLVVNLTGSDSDGTVVGYILNSLPTQGTLYADAGLTQLINVGDQVAGPVYFKPAADWSGSTSFNYSAVDNQGLSDATPATANITLNPVADQAVISNGTGSVKEDTPAQAATGGTLSITDPDAGEAGFQPQTNVAGTYGSFSLDAAGHWTYTLDNANPLVQALREGETGTDSFAIHSIDGTSATVAVLVKGTLDTSTANLSATGSVTEGGTITYTATLSEAAQGPVTVNLSNGAAITIADGALSGTVSIAAPADDVYLDSAPVSVTIGSISGGNFENLAVDATPAVTQVSDTLDTTSLSLTGATTLIEGNHATYNLTLSEVAQTPVVVTLAYSGVAANGVDFTGATSLVIAAGSNGVGFDVNALVDGLVEGTESFTVSIVSAAGGNFENLVIEGNAKSVTTSLLDLDAATLSLTATPSLTEAGGTLVYTATITQAPVTDLSISLSNGQSITIQAGQLSGSTSLVIPGSDDAYIDPSNLSATITGTTGGGISLAINNAPATTSITDTLDTTTLNLSATGNVAEGGSIVYTATLTNAAQGPVTVNLSNGSVITIADGATTGTVSVLVHSDTVYVDAGSVSTSIASATGGNFENLSFSSAPVVTTVTDIVDVTTVTLSAAGSVQEGNSIVYTATLTNAAQGPVTVNLSNGSVITIADGATTGTVSVPVHSDTVYLDAGSVSTSIASASGGNFENLSFSSTPVLTTVTDIVDVTTVTLSAASSVQEGNNIVYTATLTNAAQGPVTVNLSNGSVITIADGATSGTVSVPVHSDTVYVDAGSVSTSIASVSGGNFENLSFSSTPVVTTVTDIVDVTTVTLSAASSVQEGNSIVYTATLTNAAQGLVTVNLSNGSVITIADGATTGIVSVPVHGDTVYLDAGSVSTSIASASGGNFESLSFSSAPVITTVTDTSDTTTLSLSATGSVQEGNSIVYTATLTNAAQGPVTVNLSNGSVITIADGATAGTVSVPVHGDTVYVDAGSVSTSIASATGGNFESLTFSSTPVVTTVTDTPDTTTLSLSAAGNVAEGGSIVYTATLTNAAQGPVTVSLSNGSAITIADGATSGTVSVPVHGDTVYLDAGSVSTSIASATGGNFENLSFSSTPVVTTVTDIVDVTTVTLSATGSVQEGNSIVYTATLTNAAQGPVTVNLSNGSVITIADGATTGTVSVPVHGDTAYLDAGSVSTSIASATGGNFENLSFSSTPVLTTVTDTVDVTTVTLSAASSVQEGNSIVYTATLTNAAQGLVTVNLSNGSVITIADGATTGIVSVPVHGDTVYLDAGSVSTSIASASGGNFESLSFSSAPVITTVTDTSDPTTLSLSATSSVQEGNNIVYTATLTNAAQGSVTVNLSNGSVITIADGATTGTVSVPVHSDTVYVDAGSVSTSIASATGGNFENLSFSSAPVVTTVTDIVDVTTVTLSAAGSVQEGNSIVYTATLTNAAQGPVTVNLSNGSVITIANGATTGTVSVPVHSDTVYVDAGSVSASIASASGGNFENLSFSSTPVVTVVSDTINVTTLSLTGVTSIAESSAGSYTLSLSNPAQTAVTVNLAYSGTAINGADYTGVASVTIPAGSSSVNFNIQTLTDALVEGNENFTVTIGSVSGGNFESLAISGSANSVTTTIQDNHAPVAVNDTASGSTGNLGLVSEYFGYREGTDGANLTNLSQIFAFISGRTPDATFTAKTFDYGAANTFGNNLGAGTNLQTFLGSDASSLSTDPGDTSDAIIHMRGFVQLAAGSYNFRVLGDDGYQVKVDGVVVAESNKNQSPTTTVYAQFSVGTSGLHNIEVVYWDQGGNASFKLELSNDSGTTYNLLSSIPTYRSAGWAVVEDTPTSFTKASLLANDTDSDGDSLSITSVQGAVHGTVAMVGSNVVFTPDANYNGPASFTYTISDGRGGSDTATVNLSVTPVNDAPVAVNDSARTNVDTAVTINAATLMNNDSDVDADTLSISSVQGAVNGSVSMSGSNITFTPTAGFEGNGSFTYTIKDLEGASSTATVTVGVGTAQAVSVVTEKFLSAIEHAGAATSISLPIVTTLVDTDGSESLSIKLTGVPSGATLNHGTYDTASGAWTLTATDLDSLALNLPANYTTGSGFVTLTAQVTSTEMYGGYTATTSSSFKLFGASTTTDLTATTSGSVTGTGANEYITGGSGDNNLSGANGNDLIYGLAGNDTISGGNGVDMLYGGLGNDSISGDAGTDRITGGAGNDTLTGGGDGSVDVFAWSLGDQGAAGAPAVDTVTDFGTAAAGSSLSSGGDILDLRDLLSGDHVGPSNGAGNLTNYLHFEISGANTIIHVSHTGDFTADAHTVSGSYTSSVETQQIVLTGVNLSTLYGGATTDAAIITNLLNNNKLITD